jgi:hypothetical protein
MVQTFPAISMKTRTKTLKKNNSTTAMSNAEPATVSGNSNINQNNDVSLHLPYLISVPNSLLKSTKKYSLGVKKKSRKTLILRDSLRVSFVCPKASAVWTALSPILS